MEVFGARGRIRSLPEFLEVIKTIAEHHDVTVQTFDADVIYGRLHLVSAYDHAVRAFTEGTNSTNSLGLETLLYASGEYQIQKALLKMGVKPQTASIACVVASDPDTDLESVISEILEQTGFVRDDRVLEGDRETLRHFGIRDREAETVDPDRYGELILERVAMVDVFKR
jgi:KEOPS complex subunit Cgi121